MVKKECVLLDGKIINIGPWDYGSDSETNPLPAGAEVLDLEVYQNDDGGWYAEGYDQPSMPSELDLLKQRLAGSEAETAALNLAVIDLWETLANGGAA